MSEPNRKIESIQTLRGVAIGAIFFVHTLLWSAVADAVGGGTAFHTGGLGVDLFFVISGFVVTLSLHRGGFAVPVFYLKRAFRLLPASFVMFALGITLSLIAREYFLEWPFNARSFSEPFYQAGYVLSTAFIIRLDRGLTQEFCFAHAWSLNVEEQFYLAIGAACLLFGRLFRRSHRDRKLTGLGWAAFAGCVVLHGLRAFRPEWAPEGSEANLAERLALYLVKWRFDFLLSGVALYAGSYRLRFRVPGNVWTVGALHLALFGPFLYMGWTGAMGNPPSPGWAARTAYLVVNGSFAISVFLASANVPLFPRGSIADRTLLYLGERSYAIYLLHFPFTLLNWMFIYECLPYLDQAEMTQAVFCAGGVAILTLPTAHLVHRWVELPGIAIGSRLAKRWFPS